MRGLFQQVRDAMSGRYDIRQVVGTGGMATVFEAWDKVAGQSVAIKVLKSHLAQGVPRERFRREVAVASSLDHPNIVPILTSGEKGGIVYCVMPFVKGETLRQRLLRDRTIPLPEAIQVGVEIASALGHAHNHGIMHRDVKPENILLSDGHAMVTDFGIARAILDDGANLTITGAAIGTPSYMSPEQSTGKPSDARTDVYSLGCVLHEMLVGARPFTDLPSPFARDPQKSAKRPSLVAKQAVPPEVDEIVVTALEWKPDNRYASAADMEDALVKSQEITGLPAKPESKPGALLGWAALGAAATAVLLAGFLISRIVGPVSFNSALVSVEPVTFEGPSSYSTMTGDLFQTMTRALDRRVGIELAQGPTTAQAQYVLTWMMEVDTTGSGSSALITAELRSPGNQTSLWSMPTVTTAMTRRGISNASARIARDVAAAIRAQGSTR